MKPFDELFVWRYVDAATGELRFTEVTRQFFEWDKDRDQYVMVREVPQPGVMDEQ